MGLEETLALTPAHTPAFSPRRGGSTHSSRNFHALWVWHCFMETHVGGYVAKGREDVRPNEFW